MTNGAYNRAIFTWVGIYAVLLAISLWLLVRGITGPLLLIVTLMPMIAGFGILSAVMRRYRSMDELEQRIVGEGIVFGFGWAALLTFSYGFLENSAHAPVLSYFWVWPVMASGWIVGTMLARRRYR